eukprot:jgi/Mesvir1/5917/Mv00686-RA.1
MRLQGKVALITGGAKGLGEADARLFVKEGATVYVGDIDDLAGQKLVEELGSSASYVHLDVTNESQWQAVLNKIMEERGALHVLVNNAGNLECGTVLSTSTDSFHRVMATHVDGMFFGCKYSIPLISKSGGGSILNMSSVTSLAGYEHVFAYSAAKGAIEAFTRSAAVFCHRNKTGVRINSVHPAAIVTPMVMALDERMREAGFEPSGVEKETGSTPGMPNDVAYMVLYLASDESKFLNGLAMLVDNGTTITPGIVV